jgi:hypothetical protein
MVLAVGGLTAIAFRWRRWRATRVPAAASLSVAAMYTIVSQYRHRYAADFIWPAQFAKMSLFGLAAVFLLLGEAARDLLVPDVPTEPAPPTPQVRSGAPEVDDVGQR